MPEDINWRVWITGLLHGRDLRTGCSVNPEDPLLAASDFLQGLAGTSTDRHDHLEAVLGLVFDRTWALRPEWRNGGGPWVLAESEIHLLLSHLLAVIGPVEREVLSPGAVELLEEIATCSWGLSEGATG